jgi:translation initiation factor IF-3
LIIKKKRRGKYHGNKSKRIRVNMRIRADKIRLIDADGEQLGICSVSSALSKSREAGLDLVEVAPKVNPPVCRIMDFAKYKYEQEKKKREAKKHQKQNQLKEIRLSPRIEEHDYEVKLKHIQKFLEKKHKVKVRLSFKGRELAHKDIGRSVMERVVKDTANIGKIEKPIKNVGRSMIVILGPK